MLNCHTVVLTVSVDFSPTMERRIRSMIAPLPDLQEETALDASF
jgi:hypothetical protein